MPESYGVRTLYLHEDLQTSDDGKVYEERVVVVQAADSEAAVAAAENEASEYCRDLDGTSYLGFAQLFHMFDQYEGPALEIFSLMRESDLDADAYIDRFFATGLEREVNM